MFCSFVAWLVGGWSVGGGGFCVAVGLVVCWVGGLLFLFLRGLVLLGCGLVGWFVFWWAGVLVLGGFGGFGGLVGWCGVGLVGWWVGWVGGVLLGWFVGWWFGVLVGGFVGVWCCLLGGWLCFVWLVGWWSFGLFVSVLLFFVGFALPLGFLRCVRLCSFLFACLLLLLPVSPCFLVFCLFLFVVRLAFLLSARFCLFVCLCAMSDQIGTHHT